MDEPGRQPSPAPPVACDLSSTAGAFAERMAEFRRLLRRHLAVRSRTAAGITFRFRADPGVEHWVRDLARREKECCGFLEFTVTADGREVCWDASAGDGEAARQALAGFYHLAD